MSDLRQGVTETQHAVLDLIEEKAQQWADDHGFEDQLRMGLARAGNAHRCTKLSDKRRYAIEAAARLIDAADEIGRMINAGDE